MSSKLVNEKVSYFRAIFSKDPLQKKIAHVIFDSRTVHPTQDFLFDLGKQTHDPQAREIVFKTLYLTLNDEEYGWKTLYKTLVIAHHLAIYGSDEAAKEATRFVGKLENLKMYISEQPNKIEKFIFKGGVDNGQAVRQEAREMLQLLRDPAAIEKERKEAKEYLGQTDSLTSRMRSGSAGQKSAKWAFGAGTRSMSFGAKFPPMSKSFGNTSTDVLEEKKSEDKGREDIMIKSAAYLEKMGQTTFSSNLATSNQVISPIRKEVSPSKKGNLLDLDDFLSFEPLPKSQLPIKSSPKCLSLAPQAVSGDNKSADLLDWF